jgi:hypothetical protein
MATSQYTTDLPTFKLNHTTPNGRTFTCTVTRLTMHCYLLESEYNTGVAQFATAEALQNFWRRLKLHLNTLNPEDPTPSAPAAVAVREVALVSAVASPTTERKIKIVEPPALGPCDGFQGRHWDLPEALQNEPARFYQPGGTKKLCPACYVAYNQSMAHYEKMRAQAGSEAQYVAVPKVAA